MLFEGNHLKVNGGHPCEWITQQLVTTRLKQSSDYGGHRKNKKIRTKHRCFELYSTSYQRFNNGLPCTADVVTTTLTIFLDTTLGNVMRNLLKDFSTVLLGSLRWRNETSSRPGNSELGTIWRQPWWLPVGRPQWRDPVVGLRRSPVGPKALGTVWVSETKRSLRGDKRTSTYLVDFQEFGRRRTEKTHFSAAKGKGLRGHAEIKNSKQVITKRK